MAMFTETESLKLKKTELKLNIFKSNGEAHKLQ